ncbi:MAG: hypothetical protein EXR27_13325 [Betaproteobacteria bacterium]|nr:hypothetical protein [Betaproteobacteria bacterium]
MTKAGLIRTYKASPPSGTRIVRDGRLRAIAVADSKRSTMLAGIPTWAEGGLQVFELPVGLALTRRPGCLRFLSPDCTENSQRLAQSRHSPAHGGIRYRGQHSGGVRGADRRRPGTPRTDCQKFRRPRGVIV